MRDQKFDSISRSLASGATRRSVLKQVTAGAAAGIAGLFGVAHTEAQGACTVNGKPCVGNGNIECFSGCCGPAPNGGNDSRCLAAEFCTTTTTSTTPAGTTSTTSTTPAGTTSTTSTTQRPGTTTTSTTQRPGTTKAPGGGGNGGGGTSTANLPNTGVGQASTGGNSMLDSLAGLGATAAIAAAVLRKLGNKPQDS